MDPTRKALQQALRDQFQRHEEEGRRLLQEIQALLTQLDTNVETMRHLLAQVKTLESPPHGNP